MLPFAVAPASAGPHPSATTPCTSGSASASAPPAAPVKPAAPLPLPAGVEMSVDQGGTKYTCSNPTAEIIDPDASNPRLIVWADCPSGRLSSVTWPTKLPGAVQGDKYALRFGDWNATKGTVTVTKLGVVGDVVEGSIDAMMSARLNRDPVRIRASFRATRTADRHSP